MMFCLKTYDGNVGWKAAQCLSEAKSKALDSSSGHVLNTNLSFVTDLYQATTFLIKDGKRNCLDGLDAI